MILITRPYAQALKTQTLLTKEGLKSFIDPLLEVHFLPFIFPTTISSLIFTSQNGVKGFCAQEKNRSFSVFTVGDQTHESAFKEGFSSVTSAHGNHQDLLALLSALPPQEYSFFYARGRDIRADLFSPLQKSGFSLQEAIVYEATPSRTLKSETIHGFKEEKFKGVLFFSYRTASIFARLIQEANLQETLHTVTAYTLSPDIVSPLMELPFRNVISSPSPQSDAFLQTVIKNYE